MSFFGGFIQIPEQGWIDGTAFVIAFAVLGLIVWWTDRRG